MESQNQIVFVVILGFLMMFCVVLIAIIITNANRRKQLLKESRIQSLELENKELEHRRQIEDFRLMNEAEEKQKDTMAKNLHDGVLPILSNTFRSMGKNAKDFGTKDFDLERMKADIKNINEAIITLRGISHNLVPPYLNSYGLIAALEQFVGQLNSAGPGALFTNKTDYGKDLPFTMAEQLNIYRVCLELLNNVSKHGNYKLLTVTVEKDGDYLTVDMIHDGKKITNEEVKHLTQNSKGLGLKSIQSRLMMLNATIDYSVDMVIDVAKIHLRFPFKA